MIKLFAFLFCFSAFAYAPYELDKIHDQNLVDDSLKGALYGITSKHHHSLGLKRAKKVIYQKLFLVEKEHGFFVHDHYCDTWKYISTTRGMNVEHTKPKSRFNKQFSFSMQESDLHHLFPVNGTANAKRGSYPFAKVNGNAVYQQCPASQIGMAVRLDHLNVPAPYSFQPPRWHRGNVARALFYFAIRYQLEIDPYEEYYLRWWHKEDPVDLDEIIRNDIIEDSQGNRNPFVDFPELETRVSDF